MSDYDDDEDDCPYHQQTFLFPVGSILKEPWNGEELTVMGYVTYGGDIFHILLDKYMEEFDEHIDRNSSYEIVGQA